MINGNHCSGFYYLKFSNTSVINCTVDAGDSIRVNGRFGAIIGGTVHALNMISATLHAYLLKYVIMTIFYLTVLLIPVFVKISQFFQ